MFKVYYDFYDFTSALSWPARNKNTDVYLQRMNNRVLFYNGWSYNIVLPKCNVGNQNKAGLFYSSLLTIQCKCKFDVAVGSSQVTSRVINVLENPEKRHKGSSRELGFFNPRSRLNGPAIYTKSVICVCKLQGCKYIEIYPTYLKGYEAT